MVFFPHLCHRSRTFTQEGTNCLSTLYLARFEAAELRCSSKSLWRDKMMLRSFLKRENFPWKSECDRDFLMEGTKKVEKPTSNGVVAQRHTCASLSAAQRLQLHWTGDFWHVTTAAGAALSGLKNWGKYLVDLYEGMELQLLAVLRHFAWKEPGWHSLALVHLPEQPSISSQKGNLEFNF